MKYGPARWLIFLINRTYLISFINKLSEVYSTSLKLNIFYISFFFFFKYGAVLIRCYYTPTTHPCVISFPRNEGRISTNLILMDFSLFILCAHDEYSKIYESFYQFRFRFNQFAAVVIDSPYYLETKQCLRHYV